MSSSTEALRSHRALRPRVRRPDSGRKPGGGRDRRRLGGVIEPRRRDLLPALATALATLVLTSLPLALEPSYYFTDDTAGGAYGQWYELGQQLRTGHWPMLAPDAWMAGNHIGEGQWGLFNPVVWVIALITTAVPQASAVAAGVKLFFLTVGAVGAYGLARSYGARPALAMLAGVSAPVAGWTLYLDAPAWVTNLEVWAYFPWVMAAVRRYMWHRRGIVVALIAGLLLVTVGYIQGTIMLVLMFLALAVEAAVRRHWSGLMRMLLAGIPMGLMAVTVYLPGVLTSDVTVRAQEVGNTGFMTLTLNGLAVSTAPSGRPDLSGWWGRYPNLPYTYIAWFLPLVLLVSVRRVRALLPRLSGLLVFGVIVLLWAAGPSQLGPLRFPIRSMPWVALVAIVLAAVLLSRAVDADRVRAKLPLVALATLISFWLSYSAVTDTWRIQLLWGLLSATALLVTGWLMSSSRHVLQRAALAGAIGVSAVFSGLQTVAYAHDAASFGVTGFPTSLEEYTGTLREGRGEAIVVGDPRRLPDGMDWASTLWGSTWYLADLPVANVYSPTGFLAFNDDVCMDPYYGGTCDGLLGELFAPDPTTGATLADLMSIDTVQILASQERSIEELRSVEPPAGWKVTAADDDSVLWVREGEIDPVGGPTWVTPGMDVMVERQDANGVRMVVDDVPAEGGKIVLSRLDWPGYRVTGGKLAEPTRGYLVTVDVPSGHGEQTVDVSFRPPGWGLEVSALVASLVFAVGLVVVTALRRRPRRAG